MNTRFRDYTTCLDEFEKVVLVQCPQCDRCARSSYQDTKLIWQLVCGHCGYSKTNLGKTKQYGTAIDPVFGFPLWFQRPCCGEVLWAYNIAHLEFLEHYVQATLREKQSNQSYHHSIAVRLPQWMKLAKNRTVILKDIQHLKSHL